MHKIIGRYSRHHYNNKILATRLNNCVIFLKKNQMPHRLVNMLLQTLSCKSIYTKCLVILPSIGGGYGKGGDIYPLYSLNKPLL